MEFVSWDDEIPNWMENFKIKNVPKHQPAKKILFFSTNGLKETLFLGGRRAELETGAMIVCFYGQHGFSDGKNNLEAPVFVRSWRSCKFSINWAWKN